MTQVLHNKILTSINSMNNFTKYITCSANRIKFIVTQILILHENEVTVHIYAKLGKEMRVIV